MKKKRQKNRGITLIENLVSMSLFLLILLGALEIFNISRNFFHRLKNDQETRSAARAALDKIKADLADCGLGLVDLPSAGILAALEVEDNTLTLRKAEKTFILTMPLTVGQTLVALPETVGIKRGQEIFFFDAEKGETRTVAAVEGESLLFSPALENSYESNCSIVLLSRISFYLDKSKYVLRRKVNSSPAQPLCEGAQCFECVYDSLSNLVKLRLCPISAPEQSYELYIFPENIGLAALH